MGVALWVGTQQHSITWCVEQPFDKTRAPLMNGSCLPILILAGLIFAGCTTRQLDYTHGKPSRCEAHGVLLVRTTVPVSYGLFPVDERAAAMYHVRMTLFPHAQDWLNPSCRVGGPSRAVIYVCPECQVARHQWESEYDSTH